MMSIDDLVEMLKGFTDRQCRTVLVALMVNNEHNETVIRAVETTMTEVAAATS